MRHSFLFVVALSIAFMVSLIAGASATGPGGWDNLGTAATPTAAALNGGVYALRANAPGVLYVGGASTDAGGNSDADYIASWNGRTWAALGSSPLNGAVHSIAYFGGNVYVGGVFTNAGGNANADFLAVWDGKSWGTVCKAPGPAINGIVFALEVVGSTLYVGGAFLNGAGIRSADALLACDLNSGASRSTVSTEDGAFAGPVYALTADRRGVLYAGGGFSNLDRISAADKVAYLDGGGWHAMGSGTGPGGGALTDFVRSLASNGTDVYVGTDSTNVAGIAQADHVVKWNGSAWSALGSNTGGTDGWFPASASINALATSGSRVFAGGTFMNANGEPLADQIAFFDGSAWRPLGSNGVGDGPFSGNVSALATFGQQLVAGGSFTSGGGNRLARFVASRPLSPKSTPPPPVAGKSVNVAVASGTVRCRRSPSASFTKVTAATQFPIGEECDTTKGALVLTSAAAGAKTQAGVFSGGRFVVRQTKAPIPVTVLTLSGPLNPCTDCRIPSGAGSKRKRERHLFGSGKGHFETMGKYASASVKGTAWEVQDTADATVVRVTSGTVTVYDSVKHRHVTVRAHQTYVAKAKGKR